MNTNTEKSATSSLRTSNDTESDRYYMNMKVPAEESTIIAKSHGLYGMLCRILSFYLYLRHSFIGSSCGYCNT